MAVIGIDRFTAQYLVTCAEDLNTHHCFLWAAIALFTLLYTKPDRC